MKRAEIQKKLGLKHRVYFVDNYLNPAVVDGYVEMTYPDKPKHPDQHYKLTEKGEKRQKITAIINPGFELVARSAADLRIGNLEKLVVGSYWFVEKYCLCEGVYDRSNLLFTFFPLNPSRKISDFPHHPSREKLFNFSPSPKKFCEFFLPSSSLLNGLNFSALKQPAAGFFSGCFY